MKHIRLFSGISMLFAVLIISCKSSPQETTRQSNAFTSEIIAGFHIDREVEDTYTVLSAGTFYIELIEEAGEKYAEVLYTPDSNPDMITDLFFKVNTEPIKKYEAQPQTLPIEMTADHAKITVRYQNTQYTALLPLYPEKEPEPYSGVAAVQNPYLRAEIALITQVQQFLEKHAHAIWAGWDTWRDDTLFVILPGGSELAVSHAEKMPHRFRPIQGISLFGKRFFADESRYEPIKYGEWPLSWHGKASMNNIITMNILKIHNVVGKTGDLKTAVFSENPDRGTDPTGTGMASRFFTYIHEAFHCEQYRRMASAMMSGTTPPRREVDTSLFSVDTAVYASLEGQYLAASYNEKDDKKALELFKNACAARFVKQAALSEPERRYERHRSTQEGTAVYTECCAALQQEGREAKTFFRDKLSEIKSIIQNVPDHYSQTYYTYGAYWSFLLDRFAAGWKESFFEQNTTIDDILSTILSAGSAEQTERISAIKKTPEYAAAAQQYRSMFEKKRDVVVSSFGKGGGMHYLVDFSKIAMAGFNIDPYEILNYGKSSYFPKGLKEFRMNSFVLQSDALAFRSVYNKRSQKHFIEWYDSRPAAPYTITGTQNGTQYKNVSVQADGISFTVDLAEITQTKDTVTITVLK